MKTGKELRGKGKIKIESKEEGDGTRKGGKEERKNRSEEKRGK